MILLAVVALADCLTPRVVDFLGGTTGWWWTFVPHVVVGCTTKVSVRCGFAVPLWTVGGASAVQGLRVNLGAGVYGNTTCRP